MFSYVAAASMALLPLAISAPTKRSEDLNCVQFQYAGPFTSFGANGFVQLFANTTTWNQDTQAYKFTETRVGLVDGKIQSCGDCRTTELFGFEVCQNSKTQGYDGSNNTPGKFYGHLLYTNQGNTQCLGAAHSAGNLDGVDLVPMPCSYDYDTVGTNGQYWVIDAQSQPGAFGAQLVQELNGDELLYGPSPEGAQELYDVAKTKGADAPWTYYGFKVPSL